jgi:hypothetical protein
MVRVSRGGRSRYIIALAVLGASTVLASQRASRAEDCPVVFQRKLFTDMGDTVVVSGSLPDVLGYKFNTVTMVCYKVENACLRNDVESIGTADNGVCQVSRVDPPERFEIQQWSDAKIVANLSGAQCGGGETWVIDREAETAEVTSYPPACPGPVEQVWTSEKKDLEKMLKERPDLAHDPFFTKQMADLNEGLAAAAKYRNTIYRAAIDDPPFWQEWKKKFKRITGHEPQ